MYRSEPDRIRRLAVDPKKKRGQHFLTDNNVLKKISGAASLTKKDLVLEVGPGTGALTQYLLEQAGFVVAVEIDRDMIALLEERFAQATNFMLVKDDILSVDLPSLLKSASKGGPNFKIVANIPYNISSRFFRVFLEGEPKPESMVVLIQREVAERICARPPDMNLLALSVQFFGTPSVLFRVSRNCFYPKPKVESAVIEIQVKKRKDLLPKNIQERFFRLTKAGFSSKRKLCVSNLSRELAIPIERVKDVFTSAGIPEKARAQEITMEQWKQLASFLAF